MLRNLQIEAKSGSTGNIFRVVVWGVEASDDNGFLTIARYNERKTIRVVDDHLHTLVLGQGCVIARDGSRSLADFFAYLNPFNARGFKILQAIWDNVEGVDAGRTIGGRPPPND